MALYTAVSNRELNSQFNTPGASEVLGDTSNDDNRGLYRDEHKADPLARSASLQAKRKKRNWIIIIAVGLLLVVAALGIGLGIGLSRKGSEAASSSGGTAAPGSPKPTGSSSSATSGSSGSIVTFDDGTKYTYQNEFGGDWTFDPKNPFGSGGKAQSWSPRVGSEQWQWGTDIVRGVNLGQVGWLVTEPFIVPALYEEYVGKGTVNVIDEWTLSQAMGSDLATRMEQHYKTFITEQDFAEVAAAGLNWVRIPIGFWAIETMPGEPFLPKVSWTYFLKAIQWARKYGLRIFMDVHALPGSQNGWNHSGKSGDPNFMYGAMGIANAQRTLSYLRIFVEFISQPQYRDVIPLMGIVNEILYETIGKKPVQSFYYAAYQAIRKSTGIGAGAGPYIAIHEGFQGVDVWAGFLAGSDRVVLDQHPYLAFLGGSPALDTTVANSPCNWATATNQSSKVFGVTVGGEFSAAINSCGLWLNGIGGDTAACSIWNDWKSYTPATVAGLRNVVLASMDALQNYFFWTWKIGNSTVLGTSSCPMWDYKLGRQQGWVPKDPRDATGYCASVLGASSPFDGTYPSTATGGTGAGTLDPIMSASNPFPPATVSPSYVGSKLPIYTPTGTLHTLPGPTFTAAPKASVGSGWNNAADTDLAYVPVSGCQYPNAWDAISVALPATTCA